MRPIEKKSVGQIISYEDSSGVQVNHEIPEEYNQYGDAKLPLIGNLGRYCSYCEGVRDVDALDVEHIEARSLGGKCTAWDNLLLSCKICNSNKGNNITGTDFHWPHINNTFLSFVYDETGRVKINPNLSEISKAHAENLWKLVKLNRTGLTPVHVAEAADEKPSPKDFRWKRRYETWNTAVRYKELFLSDSINSDDVINEAKNLGHWSIWFTVFRGIDSILKRLISDFPGTCASCFDPNNHYEPVERNPGSEDPV